MDADTIAQGILKAAMYLGLGFATLILIGVILATILSELADAFHSTDRKLSTWWQQKHKH